MSALVPPRRSVEGGGGRPFGRRAAQAPTAPITGVLGTVRRGSGARGSVSRSPGPDRPARRRPPKNPRRPWFALPALVLFSLLATFFGWVSAEPFWLAVGHGEPGTAVVTRSEGGGLNNRCQGRFTAAGEAFTIPLARITGLPGAECVLGEEVPARAVSDQGREAYAGDPMGLHVRWGIGLGLVLLCGVLIAWLTGAGRFAGWQRLIAIGFSVTAPVLIAAALILAAF